MVVSLSMLLTATLSPGTVSAVATSRDLRRARTRVPRTGWRGGSFSDAMGRLNLHLHADQSLEVRPCEALSLQDVAKAQLRLQKHLSAEISEIYEQDRRSLRPELASADALRRELAADRALLASVPTAESAAFEVVLRDGRCHEAVMVYAHHLTGDDRKSAQSKGLVLPLLPSRLHIGAELGSSDSAAAVASQYERAVTCLACHVDPSVIPDPSAETPTWPPPLLPQWPRQFVANMTGTTNNSAETPPVSSYSDTGVWYYDFTNDRFRADYSNTYSDGHIENHSQLWLPYLAAPNFFLFVTKDGETTCTAMDFGFIGLLRPDAYSAANASYMGRLKHRGRWADHWQQECQGEFILYQDIVTGMPLCDGGGAYCGDPEDTHTYWESVLAGPPPEWAYDRDTSICQSQVAIEAVAGTPFRGIWGSLAQGLGIAEEDDDADLLV